METVKEINRVLVPGNYKCPVCSETSSDSNKIWSVHSPSGRLHPIHRVCFEKLKNQGILCTVCNKDSYGNDTIPIREAPVYKKTDCADSFLITSLILLVVGYVGGYFFNKS